MKKFFIVFAVAVSILLFGCSGGNPVGVDSQSVGNTQAFVGSPTTYTFSGQSGTQGFASYPGECNVIFQPGITGSWLFSAWHTFVLSPSSYVAVFTYWKDAANPNDTWHNWPGGGTANYLFWLPSKTLFYSGSKSIIYKISLINNNDFGVTVKIKLEKK